jgi:cytochrome c-type biogenesis protein CcmI
VTPLIVGALLAVVALVIVLFPLFDDLALPKGRAPARETAAPSTEAVQALREIEFDRETGKLSDSDYAALKARYTREAVAALRAEETGAQAPGSGRGGDSTIPPAAVGVFGVRPASGAGRDLLLHMRALSRRELHALPGVDRRDRGAVLRKLRRIACCLGARRFCSTTTARVAPAAAAPPGAE